MASNFTSLRSTRKSLLEKLSAEVKKDQQKGGSNDERFWKLSVDQKSKIGYARIRFLPAPKGEEVPWARVFSHAFQGDGGSWFIENCPTTLARPCPVCESNNKFWNSGIDSDKDIARKRKRKLQFIANILVIEDSTHPEHNGKVFLFKYGAKIHGKIKELIEPQFPDAQPANPFDLWAGCEFKLKSAAVAGYQNYDKSSFETPTELHPDDDVKKEALWASQYPLAEFLAEAAFKSYNELADRLQKALTGVGRAPKTAEDAAKVETPTLDDAKDAAATANDKLPPRAKTTKKVKPEPVEDAVPDDTDAISAFFSGINDSDD